MDRLSADAKDVVHQRLGEVLQRFGLGTVLAAREVAEGLMNRNWAVQVGSGQQVFVKQVLDVNRAQAARQHAATEAMAACGLPVAVPLAMPEGRTLLELDGGLYAVYPWISGAHVPGTRMSGAQAAELGETLARVHQGLAAVMDPAEKAMRMPVADPVRAKAAIDQYVVTIAGKAACDDFDDYAVAQLAERRALLEAVQHHMPDADAWWEPAGWTHGDFHDLNVLWHGSIVAAVVDFDRLAPRPYAFEMVRSATLTFCYGDDRGLAADLVTPFAVGYRAVMPLADEQIEFAIRRLWWERVCDFWQLKRHYVAGDDSCDHLFRSASALLWWWTGHREQVTQILTNQ
ncbi:MAG TPA: phosphotransferase [Streptosporangiaceae bacterium]|jgi:homoserine kinase type II